MQRPGRLLAGAIAAVGLLAGSVGVARAVSDGSYDYRKHHCTGAADDYTRPDSVEEGCRNISIVVADGNGNEFVSGGTQQTPDGEFVQPPGPPAIDPTAGDPSSDLDAYFGADDNLDVGEHDSSPQISNGPSDGGAIQFTVDPDSVALWMAALSAGDIAYLLTHPIPLVSAGFGACADGICFSGQTQRQVAFDGGGRGQRDVADYEGKKWDPESCAGPSDQREDCGGRKLKRWNRREGTVYVEPGFQFYEDPDAQASPEGPYPLPAVYAGTCGVILGGGPAAILPASPVTNSAGQVVVETGC